jgi:hypothetical protein
VAAAIEEHLEHLERLLHDDGDAPPIADVEGEPGHGLCGKTFAGIPAPDHADKCVVCAELAGELEISV